MDSRQDGRRWTHGHPDGPRLDVNGVAWEACDPYPTWYRWENGRLIYGRTPRFPKEKLVEARVTTRHPEHYRLVNEADGTEWRMTSEGSWEQYGEKS